MIENGLGGMSFFEITPVGLPVAVCGLVFLSAAGSRLLPARREPLIELGDQTREFVVVMKVGPGYQHAGSTVEAAGLRHLKGLFLFQIERENEKKSPVGPDDRIEVGDRLFFTGLPETILELQKTRGLSLLKDAVFDLKHYDSDDLGTFEVVVSPHSPLVGANVRESNFRSRYDAVIVAIHRSGERIREKIGDVVLRAGDTLLIISRRDFVKRWYHSSSFYLVSRSVDVPSKPRRYAVFASVVLGAMIACMALQVAEIVVVVACAAVALVLGRCITAQEARTSVEWNVLLVIASAFGIARGLENAGVAYFLANALIGLAGALGTVGLLAAIYFMTSLYTELITNTAAAAFVFPVALSAARQAGADPRPFLIAVAIAASASFATPIGYQTNLMVYGPGGYKFNDFLRIGVPMNLLVGIIAVAAISIVFLA
jgi:di/tricarboxylate transporter